MDLKGISRFGIGTDIENIDRFKGLDLTTDSAFLNKIFTQSELAYCFSKAIAAPHLAARYTGKEAIVKALSNIVETSLSYKDVEILNNEKGAPFVRFNNKALNMLKAEISLSHCEDKAIAFAVVLEVDGNE